MDKITELRGLIKQRDEAERYWLDHMDESESYHVFCELQEQLASKADQSLPALLDVAEAARKAIAIRNGKMYGDLMNANDALERALAKLDQS
jgi:hypothetical protein